jgi:predicted RNA polymerase sigma factor
VIDAVKDALVEALRIWPDNPPRDRKADVSGLLALMLLHHARRAARRRADDSLVPLSEQDRSLWDTRLIAEGVAILQAALARDRLGEFQVQAAIAALHADAPNAEEIDWVQIVEWYDELVRLTDSPVARLNRAVAVGGADGPRAGLAALAPPDATGPPGSTPARVADAPPNASRATLTARVRAADRAATSARVGGRYYWVAPGRSTDGRGFPPSTGCLPSTRRSFADPWARFVSRSSHPGPLRSTSMPDRGTACG